MIPGHKGISGEESLPWRGHRAGVERGSVTWWGIRLPVITAHICKAVSTADFESGSHLFLCGESNTMPMLLYRKE